MQNTLTNTLQMQKQSKFKNETNEQNRSILSQWLQLVLQTSRGSKWNTLIFEPRQTKKDSR